uniref:Uncharacterized protein n=1 Tax=Anopheles albimanus TaxID=7167 RepID=A0A8W7K5P5_ANOAL
MKFKPSLRSIGKYPSTYCGPSGAYTPYSPCGPCTPCPVPCTPCSPYGQCRPYLRCGSSWCGPTISSAHGLHCIPQCPTIYPPQRCGPRFITVQQPPRLVAQKEVIHCRRVVYDRCVVSHTKAIVEPKLIYRPKTICEPCIIYKRRTVAEPRIVYCRRFVPDPRIICRPRTIVEPKEVCTTLVCHPRPQTVQIPPPRNYCCVPSGINFSKNCYTPPRSSGYCALRCW